MVAGDFDVVVVVPTAPATTITTAFSISVLTVRSLE